MEKIMDNNDKNNNEIEKNNNINNNTSETSGGKKNADEYEKVCYICRRSESRAGKMISMPNNIYICADCMQRTFDSLNNSGINYDDMMKNIPGMGNIGGFVFGDMQDNMTNKQKVKKKKEKTDSKKDIDLTKIPAPHHIKEMLDQYVVGQEHAKKIMSVAVDNHSKRGA